MTLAELAGLLDHVGPRSPLAPLLRDVAPQDPPELAAEAAEALAVIADPVDVIRLVHVAPDGVSRALLCSDGFAVTQLEVGEGVEFSDLAPIDLLVARVVDEVGPGDDRARVLDADALVVLGLIAAAGVAPGVSRPRAAVAALLAERLAAPQPNALLDALVEDGRLVARGDELAFHPDLAEIHGALLPRARFEIHRVQASDDEPMSAVFVGTRGQRWWVYPHGDGEVLIVRPGADACRALVAFALGVMDGRELYAPAHARWAEALTA